MEKQFERVEALFGESLNSLTKKHVAVFGLGGVGGYIVETLIRSGLKEISIIDSDTISITNLNRQIIATHETMGKNKTDVMKERILNINPNCIIHTYNLFFSEETMTQIPFESFDYVCDAIDSVASKVLLIKTCVDKNIPIISSMGTGNKLDPTKLEITDISKTRACPLAKTIRQCLRKIGINHLDVVFSTEENTRTNILDNGKLVPSSFMPVPATAGLIIGRYVIQQLIKE